MFRALAFRQSKWQRTNARNVSFLTCYGGPFTFSRGSPILFFVTREWAFFLYVKQEWGFIFSVIRESLVFLPWETGFRCFRNLWKMHLLLINTRDLWTIDFCGNNFSLFGDFSVVKARKLHQTGCKKRDGMPFSTSLDARDGWRTEN